MTYTTDELERMAEYYLSIGHVESAGRYAAIVSMRRSADALGVDRNDLRKGIYLKDQG